MDQTAWLLLSKRDSDYAGNAGYADVAAERYLYDSDVPNHKRLAEGDLAIVVDGHRLLGIGSIEQISAASGAKTRYRCPQCRTADIWRRNRRKPPYRCKAGHEFEEPLKEDVKCTTYAASFDGEFVSASGVVPIQRLREACLNYNQQLSMQPIDVSKFADALAAAVPEVRRLLDGPNYLHPDEGATDAPADENDGYAPGAEDTREVVNHSIRLRRGQRQFRTNLRRRYGDACVISGCKLVDLLEAAHIQPYRGESYNHVENGLLLRADLHTLFDLDLLGIEPDALIVRLHPAVRAAGYEAFDGARLRCRAGLEPSRAALEDRWRAFMRRCDGNH